MNAETKKPQENKSEEDKKESFAEAAATFFEDHGPKIALTSLALIVGAILGKMSQTKMVAIDKSFVVDLKQDEFETAKAILDRRLGKSWVSRNPALAGALTLGIAPTIINGGLAQETIYEIRRECPDLVDRLNTYDDQHHKRFVELQEYHQTAQRSAAAENITNSIVRAIQRRSK